MQGHLKMDFRLLIIALCFPLTLHASFIESTMGTAVVNDATATYHNPAALSLIKKPQFIALGSYALFPSYFVGQSISYTGAVNQSGQSKADTDYFLPSIYASIPIQDKIKVGFSVLSDLLNSEINEASILRYLTANNKIENVDFVSGLDIDVNEYLSIGAGFVYSHARFTSNPIIGLGNLITPDSQSHNVTADDGYGGNIGFLIKPMKSILIIVVQLHISFVGIVTLMVRLQLCLVTIILIFGPQQEGCSRSAILYHLAWGLLVLCKL